MLLLLGLLLTIYPFDLAQALARRGNRSYVFVIGLFIGHIFRSLLALFIVTPLRLLFYFVSRIRR